MRGCHTLVFLCRQTTGEYGLGNQGQRHPLVESYDGRPFAGAFLTGGVEYPVDDELALLVATGKDVAGNLDQVAVQFALVPFLKNFVHLEVRQAK